MDTAILTGIISAGTSVITVIAIKPFVDRKLLVYQLKQNFRSEQTKKIKDVFAVYKNGLLKSAELLNARLKNYAKNHAEGWLNVNGNYTNPTHYLDTTVYRFIAFFAYVHLIEKKLIYLDTTISDSSDLRTIKYFRLFHEIMCDVELFDGFTYDKTYATDHFFTTPFENISNSLIQSDSVINLENFDSSRQTILPKIEKVFKYFDGMSPTESRLRYERIKIFHLALIAFLNEFGYDYQRTSHKKIQELKIILGNYKLLSNFEKLVKKYKLNKFLGNIERVIKKAK